MFAELKPKHLHLHKSQDVRRGATQESIDEWIDKQNGVYT